MSARRVTYPSSSPEIASPRVRLAVACSVQRSESVCRFALGEGVGCTPQALRTRTSVVSPSVSLLPVIPQTLHIALDSLVSDRTTSPLPAPIKRRLHKKIRHQLECIEALPVAEQRAIMRVINSLLAAHQRCAYDKARSAGLVVTKSQEVNLK